MSAETKDILLKELALNFFQGNHTFKLNQPKDVDQMDWEWQERFLAKTFNSDIMNHYPTSYQLSKLFLKNLIGYLEPKHEVHNDIYGHLCRVMKASEHDGFCYRHYIIGKDFNQVIIMKETRSMVVNGTTGLKTWEAALMLADWALCNKDIFKNKNILELGAGVGFAGITIAKMCDVKSMLLSDCHDEVLTTIKENIQINFPHLQPIQVNNLNMYNNATISIGAMMLDWNHTENQIMNVIPVIPDVIIGADIVYDPSILVPLCKVLQTFSKKNNLVIYIASVIRNEETFKGFLRTLDSMNCSWEKNNLMTCIHIDWNENVQKCLLKIKFKTQ